MPLHHTAYDEDDHAAIMQHSHAMSIRNDADGIFLARELDYVKAQAYDIKYTRLSATTPTICPVLTCSVVSTALA
jgi:hypothetical protein